MAKNQEKVVPPKTTNGSPNFDTMSIIQNIDLIKGFMTESQLQKLEKHASFFDDRNRIRFSILDVTDNLVTIGVKQQAAPKVFLAAERELVKVAKSLFGFYLDGFQLDIKVGEYAELMRALAVAPPVPKEKPTNETKPSRYPDGKGIIENSHLIEQFISEEKLRRMEKHALFFAERSNIHFKVCEVTDPDILVSVEQREVKVGAAIRPRELETICKSFFEFYLDDMRIHLQSRQFSSLKKLSRSAEWYRNEIAARGITVEQISDETGLSVLTLRAWLDGKQGMSTLAKAMFHYMLK